MNKMKNENWTKLFFLSIFIFFPLKAMENSNKGQLSKPHQEESVITLKRRDFDEKMAEYQFLKKERMKLQEEIGKLEEENMNLRRELEDLKGEKNKNDYVKSLIQQNKAQRERIKELEGLVPQLTNSGKPPKEEK